LTLPPAGTDWLSQVQRAGVAAHAEWVIRRQHLLQLDITGASFIAV
jgi:hypothetical protein